MKIRRKTTRRSITVCSPNSAVRWCSTWDCTGWKAIAAALIDNGKPADTPCCVISRATLPAQQAVESTLAEIAELANAAGLQAPSLFIVGESVSQRETISWFERLPLFGQRIGITRPIQQADWSIGKCLELGAEPVVIPLIEIHPPEDWSPVDAVLQRVSEFDWIIFTSANGVSHFLNRLWETGGDARRLANAKIACIGPATAEALHMYSLRADLVPESYRSEDLAAALQPHVAGKRVVWPRASRGRDVLPDVLTAAGAEFEQVVAYRNIDVESLVPDVLSRIEHGELDWIALSSPSIARSLSSLLSDSAKKQIGGPVKLASISPVTTAAATEIGLRIAAEATTYTWDGVFDAIVTSASGG